eukprot:jgi/Astpho2/9650/Aster-03918
MDPAVTGREAPEANNAANEPRGKAVDAFDELNQSGMAQVDTHKASFAPQTVLLHKEDAKDGEEKTRVVDLNKLTRKDKEFIVERALEAHDQDAERLYRKLKARQERVGIEQPSMEVRFEDLKVEAKVYVGNRAVPTVINSYRNFVEDILDKVHLRNTNKRKFTILNSVSGVIKPGVFTLLLGPPGSGKTTLLTALAGKLQGVGGVKTTGRVTYNGKAFKDFLPQRTAAYIDQVDNHYPELTVRETFDFAARTQGAGLLPDLLQEIRRREKEQGIEPDWEIDAFMKASVREGKRESITTDLILKLLALDVCSETPIGNQMIRGVSGGQRKRVTTGEMMVGPKSVLLMDEISTGLDSSNTFQIVRCIRDFVHLRQATVLMALLQPAPETYELFDDVLLLSEGHVIYHGPVNNVMDFFEGQGFRIPERKGIPDFLQEVTSYKDQAQYWHGREKHQYVGVAHFAEAFRRTMGKESVEYLQTPYQPPNDQCMKALQTRTYALPGLKRFKALMRREVILVQRTLFIYYFKTSQVVIMALISATLYLRTHIHPVSPQDGNEILGYLFFTMLIMLFNGIAEMSMTVERLSVFHKQRNNHFYDAFSFVMPGTIMRLPYSLLEAVVWTVLSYFPVGLAGQPDRFFMFLVVCFLMHSWSVSLFRMIGALARNIVVANAIGSLAMLGIFLMGGFVIAKPNIHPWVVWIYWANPLAYAQRAVVINEFTAGHWQDKRYPYDTSMSLGDGVLKSRGFSNHYWWCWVGIGVLIMGNVIFNIGLIAAHAYLPRPACLPVAWNSNKAVVSDESLKDRAVALHGDGAGDGLAQQAPMRKGDSKGSLELSSSKHLQGGHENGHTNGRHNVLNEIGNPEVDLESGEAASSLNSSGRREVTGRGMVLPFEPMTMTFKDVHYYVEIPKEAAKDREHVHLEGKKHMLELLQGIDGAFRPGVLTSLMGVSGAGKTTLMDVLSGRKTGGKITGDVRINGHPKEQDSFARISGYVEQFDIHSSQTTVREALQFSAHLRTKHSKDTTRELVETFIDEVMALVELDPLRDVLVGRPGQSGLSVEQRKRLTIAVELVANPSIVFMDEPTSGLDARAAAIVMRTVRNIVNTGRTIVCTIHQPSIDIFEAFDELLLLKRGGETIYNGKLGEHSAELIKYFSAVNGVPRIKEGLNPATWMLEVTTLGMEKRLGLDFAQVYKQSNLAKRYESIIQENSQPKEGSQPLNFETKFAKNTLQQFVIIWRKFMAIYWRTPEYNGVRFFFAVCIGLLFGAIFWKLGDDNSTQLGLFNVLGALYATTLFFGIINSIVVQPVVAEERAVSYREKAAGMYSILPWVGALGCVEIIYVLVQSILYTCVVYFMCGFLTNAAKFFWFLLFMVLTLCYFTFYGIMAVAITPNIKVAAVMSSNFYVTWLQNMPGWWIWYPYINPVFWSVWGLIASQVGDEQNSYVLLPGGDRPSVASYVRDSFGYRHEWLGYVVIILIGWVGVFWFLCYYALRNLNFLKR